MDAKVVHLKPTLLFFQAFYVSLLSANPQKHPLTTQDAAQHLHTKQSFPRFAQRGMNSAFKSNQAYVVLHGHFRSRAAILYFVPPFPARSDKSNQHKSNQHFLKVARRKEGRTVYRLPQSFMLRSLLVAKPSARFSYYDHVQCLVCRMLFSSPFMVTDWDGAHMCTSPPYSLQHFCHIVIN